MRRHYNGGPPRDQCVKKVGFKTGFVGQRKISRLGIGVRKSFRMDQRDSQCAWSPPSEPTTKGTGLGKEDPAEFALSFLLCNDMQVVRVWPPESLTTPRTLSLGVHWPMGA